MSVWRLILRIIAGAAATWVLFTGLFALATGLALTHYGLSAIISELFASVACIAVMLFCFRPWRIVHIIALTLTAMLLGMRTAFALYVINEDWFWRGDNLLALSVGNLGPVAVILAVLLVMTDWSRQTDKTQSPAPTGK